jgi:hypothetical protein
MRGRIISPFVAVIGQLDTAAAAAESPGYDAIFREPETSIDVTGKRSKARRERVIQCRCQVETGTYELQQMTPMGNAPASSLTLVFHYCDLEEAELLVAGNRPTIKVNDRLIKLLVAETGDVATDFDKLPNGATAVPVYVTEATPSGYGFGGRVNLLVCRLGDRPQAQRGQQ